ncbi:hypothetical protein D3C86_1909230 [compost metagenome]
MFGGAHVLFYVAAMIYMRIHVPSYLQSTGQLFLFMLVGTLSGAVGNLWAGHLLLDGDGARLFGFSAVGTLVAFLVFLFMHVHQRTQNESLRE